MVRFARRAGVLADTSKGDVKKKEEATSWSDMFKEESGAAGAVGEGDQTGGRGDDQETRKRKHRDDYEKRIEYENKSDRFGGKQSEQDEKEEEEEGEEARSSSKSEASSSSSAALEQLIKRYEKSLDREVIDDLVEMRKAGKISHEELADKLYREERSNRRRLDRIEERHSSQVCFKCRKAGHSIQDCPMIKQDNEQGTGICYKCGSTEHSVSRCKVKLEPGQYPFAKCFICNEMGHLTKQCPDNPRGLYPNGGSCKFCGSVEHYAKDCPENQKKNLLADAKTAKKLRPNENLEIISDDEEDLKRKRMLQEKAAAASKKKVVFFK